MTATFPVVVKLGGSLLVLPDLADRLHSVVQHLRGQKCLMVVGGGAAADDVRRLNDCYGLTPKRAHWNAIAAMSFNTANVSRVLGCLPVISNQLEAQAAWTNHDVILVEPALFLRNQRTTLLGLLPESWSVTSDSIAAFIALHWPSRQLLFCKSCDLLSHTIEELCDAGLLDAWLPELLPSLHEALVQISWLNLRADDYSPQSLQCRQAQCRPDQVRRRCRNSANPDSSS